MLAQEIASIVDLRANQTQALADDAN